MGVVIIPTFYFVPLTNMKFPKQNDKNQKNYVFTTLYAIFMRAALNDIDERSRAKRA